MQWDREEEILLIDLYIYSKTHSDDETNKEIEEMSQLLRKRALYNNIQIDDKFRNVTGLKMKLQNIEYCFTNGKRGLSCCSKLDIQLTEEAKQNLVKILLDATEIKINLKYQR